MVGRSLFVAAVVALCASQHTYATLSLSAIKGDIVTRINGSPLSHLSTIVSGFLIPLVQKRLANVVPDGAIPGLQTRVKDLVNAGLASTVAAGCAVLHSPESFVSQFEKAVLGEVGHLGVQELIQKLGLGDLLTSDEKDLYNKFGAGYVKNALSVVVAHLLAEVKSLFGSSAAPAQA